MAQTFDARSRKVGELLGNYERRPVVVPRFQRGYSWEKQHVTTFWEDLIAFGAESERAPKSATYFFGPIVVQNRPDEIILLDGQQRLATATILLAVLRDVARTLQFPVGQKGHDLAHEIQASLIQKEDADPPFSLKLGELDSEFFRRAVQQDPPSEIPAGLRSHELIRGAYLTLRAQTVALVQGLAAEDAHKKIKLLKDAVSKGMLVVEIVVESEDDAFSIFETLNDRGLRLSVPDLLLNLLMRQANSENDRSGVRQEWNDMLRQMGRRDIGRFLRHMWLSRYGDLKARGLFLELKNHLRDNKLDSRDFAASASLDCESYVALLDQTKAIPKAAHRDVAGVIKYLGITSSLPVLLAGLQCLSEPDFARLARVVAVMAVRYALIADLNPSTLESAFYEAARKMRAQEENKASSRQVVQAAIEVLTPLNPSDAIVREKAKAVLLDRAPALWIMTELANYLQSKTREIAASEANLEHIFPRNATLAQWPNKLDLEPLVWRIGNLTILGEDFNRSASNKAFATKAANYFAPSELVITNSIPAKFSAWTPADIESRSEELAELLTQVFQL